MPAVLEPALLPKPVRMYRITVPPEVTGANAVSYTDCVEISILRYLQAVLIDVFDPSRVDPERLAALGAAPALAAFFARHPCIPSPEHYVTPEGVKERTDWSILLTRMPRPPGLRYLYVQRAEGYDRPQYELEATVPVLFAALDFLFPTLDMHSHAFAMEPCLARLSAWASSPSLSFAHAVVDTSDFALSDPDRPQRYLGHILRVEANGTALYQWEWYVIAPEEGGEAADSGAWLLGVCVCAYVSECACVCAHARVASCALWWG